MSITQVTVFGGSGFVGRAIVRALAQQGYLVRVASRRVGLAEPVKTMGDVGQVMLMQANLRNPASVARAVAGSQAVVNAAGISVPRGRQSYQAVHADGARTIAEAARAAGAQRLVHISGIGADNRSSSNGYIKSKVAAEDAVITGFNSATILRPSVVFGPNDALFNRMAAIAAKAPFVPVVGDGSARVQPVFVGDVGKAAAAVLAQPGTAKSVFEWAAPGLQLSRARRPGPARDRPPEADRRRSGRPDEAGRVLRAADRPGRPDPADHRRPGRADEARQHRAARRPLAGNARHPADCGGSHPADLSRPLPDRRPLQPARPA